MKTARLLTIGGVVVAAGVLAAWGTRQVSGGDGCRPVNASCVCPTGSQCPCPLGSTSSCREASKPCAGPSVKESSGCELSRRCPSRSAQAVPILNEAIKLLRAGNPEGALAQLAKAQELIASDARRGTSVGVKSVSNEYCPITGNRIDPRNVSASLTREFRGQRLGFCVAASPDLWDKLSEAERETRLESVTSRERG